MSNGQLQHITTHVPDALSRFLSQYQNKPRITGLLTALLGNIQSVEDALFAIPATRSLANAVGAQLDAYGTLVGLERNGLSDATYRRLIHGAIGENNSDGTMPTLLRLLSQVFDTDAVFVADSSSPGTSGNPLATHTTMGFGIGSPALDPTYFQQALTSFFKATPAGVGVYGVWTFNKNKAFSMAGPQSWANSGFGDANDATVGGGFATLIYSDTKL